MTGSLLIRCLAKDALSLHFDRWGKTARATNRLPADSIRKLRHLIVSKARHGVSPGKTVNDLSAQVTTPRLNLHSPPVDVHAWSIASACTTTLNRGTSYPCAIKPAEYRRNNYIFGSQFSNNKTKPQS
jgi:hypothetical protein